MTPFVRNMPSTVKSAAIPAFDQLGRIQMSCKPSTEPYGWTLCLETDIPQDEEHAVQDVWPPIYVMLATIGSQLCHMGISSGRK